MNETIFEQVESFASVLKLDLSAEEFAQFAEDQELSKAGMEAVRAVFSYLSRKKQQTTIQTLLKMSRLPTKAPPLRTSTFRCLMVRMWNGCGSYPH